MEAEIGDRLRLPEYSQRFSTAGLTTTLSEELAETQPAVHASGSLLQEWYRKYHPDSGSLTYAHAADLEEAMGDELRRHHSEVTYRALRTALSQRPKPVVIGPRCAQTWVETYASVAASSSSGLQRPAAASSVSQSAASSSTMKRPAGGFAIAVVVIECRYDTTGRCDTCIGIVKETMRPAAADS